ncbi:ATP-grasp fold amidoligase family protein [Brachyspira pilosicoli]|uniref:ATP-grasp fold amidoligase family protein n=1 Tax=Brachyspira pilosicoli TaxID=52584 RepID=UPI001E46011B|nr:ATP-grasp fold amidoligase family protein [Brachyspira pilosicoli]
MTKEENIKFREELIKKQFKNSLGYDLNLDNPQTFNEKIQWLKLYNHDPLITKCADKYLAREYIKEKIGEEYLIPLLGVWDKAEDIDFDLLPNQFVLKVNWGWGQNIIVKDKTKLDIEEVINKLNNWLEPLSNHYYYNFEWSYKNIKPKIICEKYIEQLEGQVYDYKVFCFNGKPKYIGVHLYRYTNHSRCIFDTKWNKIIGLMTGQNKLYRENIEKPENLELILKLSEKLSLVFFHVRVDWYIIEKKIYIGELTFYHGNGVERFSIPEWDYKWGQLLELPKEKKIEYDVLDRDTLIQQAVLLEPISVEYKKLQESIREKDLVINEKNDEIIYIHKNKNKEINDIKLNSHWFNFLTLFAISNNDEYIRIILFGIKFTFRVNENIINKISWWIPVKKLRKSFRAKFKIRPDQTRPDQTRPDLIQYVKSTYNFIIIQKLKNYNLCYIQKM